MSEFSFTARNLTGIVADQSANQRQGSIQAFLHWIDRVEIQNNLENRSGRSHSRIERRSTGFTNGPYAEIKESIGKFLPCRKH